MVKQTKMVVELITEQLFENVFAQFFNQFISVKSFFEKKIITITFQSIHQKKILFYFTHD